MIWPQDAGITIWDQNKTSGIGTTKLQTLRRPNTRPRESDQYMAQIEGEQRGWKLILKSKNINRKWFSKGSKVLHQRARLSSHCLFRFSPMTSCPIVRKFVLSILWVIIMKLPYKLGTSYFALWTVFSRENYLTFDPPAILDNFGWTICLVNWIIWNSSRGNRTGLPA